MPQMWFSRSLSHEYPLQMETSHLQLSVDMFVAHVDLPNFYITHHRCQALQHWLYNIVLPSTVVDYLSIIVCLLFRSLILERAYILQPRYTLVPYAQSVQYLSNKNRA